MYSPILRNRRSELRAVQHLSESIRSTMMPVLDVAAPTKSADKTQGIAFVERNLQSVGKIVSGFPAVFVDSSELDPAFRISHGLHPLSGLATAASKAGCKPIPVTGLHRDTAHNAAAKAIANKMANGNLCIRLDFTDVSTATATVRQIHHFIKSNAIKSPQIYLLVDLQCLYGKDEAVVAAQVLRLFRSLKDDKWAGIIVGGYALPDQISTAVPTKAHGFLRRIEQDVFRQAAAFEMDTLRWFADYATLPPSVVELDWRLIQKVMSPKALYTLDDEWFVIRGAAISGHPDGYGQYYSLAEEIVALEDYCGANYSYGDKYIFDRAGGNGTPGNPASWITACVNHHLTFTANTHQ